ncbi:MAG: potassium transporter [Deltaproteobacteria bacterium]|nr:MAG: potassium transporter [Deltaproteobacteria bacterium]
MSRLKHRLQNLSPAATLVNFYALAILAATALLMTPFAAQGAPVGFVDALFTITSAMCVTGLTVVDTASTFSLFGQLVILATIQLGGLGITTFSVYLFFYLRSGVGLRDRWVINETLVHSPVRSMHDLVRAVIHLTLLIEGIGAACLALVFVPQFGWLQGSYYAVFHAVSAFCNAGFALFSDNLIGYRNDPIVNLTIMALIILGGIGFLVMRELHDIWQRRRRGLRWRLSLHSKLVLLTSSILIVAGWAALLVLELTSGTFRSTGLGEALWVTLFQSVTTRTAGFNTIDLNAFSVPSIFLMIVLMFIGASPGSTGGGVKTTSLALFLAALYSRLKGYRVTSVFKRTVPDETVNKTFTLFLLAALWIGLMTFFVLLSEVTGSAGSQNQGVLLQYLFEVVSAFGTVGLSLGVTPKLSDTGKLLVAMLMFVGRVGLLTFAFVVVKQAGREGTEYAEENIMIG